MSTQGSLDSIFCAALDLDSAAARAAYLDRACGCDTPLRRRVEQLLEAHAKAGSFLPLLDTESSATIEQSSGAEEAGARIGPYKLLNQLGEGGMGRVWMAEQQEPLRRKVALKIIKPGMDSQQAMARFEIERQALALMDHVNIARVFDAGTTENGRPFFVMELIGGVPITKYCDDKKLTLRERLELFVPVCQAIQHAHQKGILHRDVKPSNVLVMEHDGKAAPKVIDFGVAKAVEQPLTEQTLCTQYGTIIGTFEYMSPEQAEISAWGVDTRSDIYSLGVLLYELLTGTTPLERQRLRKASYAEIVRWIREEEPSKPSTRLESSPPLPVRAAARKTEPMKLARLVRGELDWIVMKALEKDRSRRYETANGLARDIQRFLADEPVEACPPSVRYWLSKLARKHWRSLMMAAALLLLVVVGAVVSTILAIWAVGERDRATDAENRSKEQRDEAVAARKAMAEQRDKAVRSEADAKAVLIFFQNKVLSAGRPERQHGGQGTGVTLRRAVDEAVPSIAKAFADRPLVEASVRDTVGMTYWFLGEYPQAIEQHKRALTLREIQLGPDHRDTLLSRNNLADVYVSAGRFTDAIRLLEQNLKLCEAQLGPDHPDTLTVRNNLAEAYRTVGRNTEVIRLHEQTLKQREAQFGPDHPDTLTSRNNLAEAYLSVGRTAEAIRLHEQTLKQREIRLGPDHPETLRSRNNLAGAYQSAGRIVEAIRLHEQTLKQRETKLGLDHPDTLQSRNNLATAYLAVGRTDEAIRLHEQNLKLYVARLGRDHPDSLKSRHNLAAAYWFVRQLDRSIPLFEETLQRRKATLGPDHPDTLRTQANLGINYRDAGRMEEGIALLEEALQRARKLPGGPPASLAWIPAALAESYDRGGMHSQAEPFHRAALDQMLKRFGGEDARTAAAMAVLGNNLLHQHKYEDAEPLLRDCLKVRQAKQPNTWMAFHTQSLLGAALLGRKKCAEAEPLLLKGYQGMMQREKTIPLPYKARLSEARERLVQLYEATGRKDEAASWRATAKKNTPSKDTKRPGQK